MTLSRSEILTNRYIPIWSLSNDHSIQKFSPRTSWLLLVLNVRDSMLESWFPACQPRTFGNSLTWFKGPL